MAFCVIPPVTRFDHDQSMGMSDMPRESWFIEWQENGSDQYLRETVETPEEAVEVIRRLLAAECPPKTKKSAFEELFGRARPEVIIRHVRDVVVHESATGKLIIIRAKL